MTPAAAPNEELADRARRLAEEHPPRTALPSAEDRAERLRQAGNG
jgi:hypothetical protein